MRTVISFKPVDLAWGILSGIMFLGAFLACSFIANAIVYQGPPPAPHTAHEVPLWLGLLSVTVMPVTIAFAEAIVYRGYGQTRIQAAIDKRGAWIVTAVLFASQHVFLTNIDLKAQVARFIAMGLVGLIWAPQPEDGGASRLS